MIHPLANPDILASADLLPNGARRIIINNVEILFGLPIDEYHAFDKEHGRVYFSKTKLSAIMDPAKGPEWCYENWVKNNWGEDDEDRDIGESEKSHFVVGRAIDVLLFDGAGEFSRKFTEYPEMYPSKEKGGSEVMKPWHNGANFCKEWTQEQADMGISILSRAQMVWNFRAQNSVLRNERAAKFFSDPNWLSQVSFRWQDESGRWMQSRLDMVNFVTGEWCDLKTTRFYSRSAYGREFVTRGYHLQGFLGEEAFRRIGIRPRGGYHIIIGKQEFPQTRVDDVPVTLLEAGEDAFDRAMARWSECEAAGRWYDYQDPEQAAFIEVPQFVTDILAKRGDVMQREVYQIDADGII